MTQASVYTAVQDLFSQTARQLNGSPAIENGRRAATYGEIETRTTALAHTLTSLGITRGSIVAIFLSDPIEIITAIVGILKAGGVFCPLDPAFPDKRLEVMFECVSPRWCISDERFQEKLERITSGLSASPQFLTTNVESTISNGPLAYSDPQSPCSVYFTSGSTGKPKAILGRLSGIDHFVRWEISALGVKAGTRVSQLASPSFDGFLKDAFVPLCAGGVVCAPESRDVVLEPRRLVDWLDVEQVEVLHCVPSLFRALINEGLNERYFESMKHVVLAGEALLPSDVKRWMDVFGERIKLLNLYGPTETTILKTFHFVKPDDVARPSIPLGKPIGGAAVLVVDQQGQPCAVGDAGEIYIRTPYCALGYHGEPELTREVFIPNPFNNDPNDIVYKTGDYGRLTQDGNLEFLGRRDQQVKVRGVRVELGEIENLLRDHQSVRDVVVVDRDDLDGNKILVAYVTTSNGDGSGHLRQYLAERLPEAMLPSAFVELEQFPRTLNGKIDRKALPAPELAQGERELGDSAPRGPLEEIIAGIWSQVLKQPAVGRNDNFFNLGGHSLLVTQVILRVRETLRIELPIRSLFEAPVLAEFSRLVQEQIEIDKQSELPPIARVSRDGELAVSFYQRRMWFFEQLARGTSAFHFPMALKLKGALNEPALEQVFGEIIRRHESLRTVFPAVNDQPVQVIQPPSRFRLPVVDLSSLCAEERDAQVSRIAQEETQRRFVLEQGPMVRLMLVRLAHDEHVVLSTMHHIVGDGQSFEVVIAEMNRLYGAFIKGGPSPLPELQIQYVDYVAWQRQWLQGEVLQSRLAYWREQLQDAPQSLSLPQQRTRPRVQTFRGAVQEVSIPTDLTESLTELSQREGVTLQMAMLTAFVLMLNEYTGNEDIVVGATYANRDRAEAERLIGFLANTLVLRVDVGADQTFRDVLRRVREICLDAYTYQVPMELLRDDVKSRGGDGEKFYDVWFQLERQEREKLEMEGIEFERLLLGRADNRFELSMILTESDKQVSGHLGYDDQVFTERTTARMLEKYQALLRQMTVDLDQRF